MVVPAGAAAGCGLGFEPGCFRTGGPRLAGWPGAGAGWGAAGSAAGAGAAGWAWGGAWGGGGGGWAWGAVFAGFSFSMMQALAPNSAKDKAMKWGFIV